MIPDPLPWCDIVDLRLEAALSPGVPLRWGPLDPDEIDDSRLDYGRVFGPWDIPPGEPTDSLWLDISDQMVEVTWTGGSASGDTVFARWEAAQLQARFHDPDLILDPTNHLSPLQARTVPNTPVRIRGGFRTPAGWICEVAESVALTVAAGIPLPLATDVVTFTTSVRLAPEDDQPATGTRRFATGPVIMQDIGGMLQVGWRYTDDLGDSIYRTVDTDLAMPYGVWYEFRLTFDPATLTSTAEARREAAGPWEVIDVDVVPADWTLWIPGWTYASGQADLSANVRVIAASYVFDGVEVFAITPDDTRQNRFAPFTCSTGQQVTAPAPAYWAPPDTADVFAVLFGGFADSWTPLWAPEPLDRYTTLTATDGVRILSGFDPPAGPNTGNNDTAAQRVNRILNHANWPTDQRDVEAGGVAMHPTQHAQPAWTELLLTADSDLGIVWLAPDGRLSYRPGEAVRAALSAPPVASFGCEGYDIIVAANVQFDALSIRNLVTGHNGSGQPITGADEASAARYRYRSYKRTDLMMSDHDDLADWVEFVLELGAAPMRHISQMLMEPTLAPPSFRWLLIPYPLETWAISWTPPGDGTAHVVREVVTAGGWVHTVTPDRWNTVITSGIKPPLPFLQKARRT